MLQKSRKLVFGTPEESAVQLAHVSAAGAELGARSSQAQLLPGREQFISSASSTLKGSYC